MWHDKHTFLELQASEERMPTNQLSQRLKKLMKWGLVRRKAYNTRPLRYQYYLTNKGKKLEPMLLQIMRWGHNNLGGGLYDPTRGKSVSGARKKR